jgi:BASS family bile acid:Na+ symporter
METPVPFDATVELLLYVFIMLAMLCIGMSATLSEMLALLRDPTRATRAIIANSLIPPVVAFALALLFPMNDAAGTVLLLLAFAPGGINAMQFSTKSPGQLAAAGALLFLLSTIGLVTAPIAAGWLLPADAAISLPIGQLAFRVIALVIVPLAAGMAIRAAAAGIAEKLYKPAMLISTLAFVGSVLLSLSVRQDAVAELGAGTAVAMLGFILILVAVGWVLGGPDPDERQVLAVTTNLRNVGLVYVLVDGCCTDALFSTSVLAFMALMVPVNLAFTVASAMMRKRRTS